MRRNAATLRCYPAASANIFSSEHREEAPRWRCLPPASSRCRQSSAAARKAGNTRIDVREQQHPEHCSPAAARQRRPAAALCRRRRQRSAGCGTRSLPTRGSGCRSRTCAPRSEEGPGARRCPSQGWQAPGHRRCHCAGGAQRRQCLPCYRLLCGALKLAIHCRARRCVLVLPTACPGAPQVSGPEFHA